MTDARRNVNELVMGDPDCPKSDVTAAIVGSVSFGKLHEEWKTVSMQLGLPEYKIHELSQDYLLKVQVKTLPQLIDELLTIWKAEKGDQAKIVNLSEALDNCGLTDISQALSTKFGLDLPQKRSKDSLGRWSHLKSNLGKLLIKWRVSTPQSIIKPHLSPPIKPKYYVPRTLFYIPSNELEL